MTKKEKAMLVAQAAKLAMLGFRMENARRRVKKLHRRGFGASDPCMSEAVHRFVRAEGEWDALESAHLSLRRRWTGSL